MFNKLRGKKEPEYNDDEIYGGADKDYYQGDEAYDESADPVLNTESSGFQTPVAKPVSNKVEVKLAKPTSHMDGPAIADKLVGGCIVVMDVDGMEKESVIRLIDFLSGVKHVLGGQMIRTNKTTIVIAPSGVDVGQFTLEDSDEDDDEADGKDEKSADGASAQGANA